jgi:plasmid stabilization system protein ParE
MEIVYSQKAKEQIENIQSFIAIKSGYPERAKNFSNRILVFCDGLKNFPKRGTSYDHIQKGLRIVGFDGSISIAFEVESDRIYIHGIYYGGQNWSDDFEI